jgi:glycosyltransferase involved in cell wall biosynthesis
MGGSGNHPYITVITPTISGREHWLKRALSSIVATTPDVEFLTYLDLPTCGEGWNRGIPEARGRYILFFADDLEAHPGWWEAGVTAIHEDYLPCPRILNPDGTLQSCGTFAEEAEDGTPSVVARVPFLPAHLAKSMYPIFSNQYMGDHWITWRAKQLGYPTLVLRDMVFTHHFAMEGRIDTLASDVKAYHRATR